MASTVARKLRLHPMPEESPAPKMTPDWKVLVQALSVGAVLVLMTWFYFYSMRYYRAEGRIILKGVSTAGAKPALYRHLLGLHNGGVAITPEDSNSKIVLTDLLRDGRATIYLSDGQTISLLVTDSSKDYARKLAGQFAQAYLSQVAEAQNSRSRNLTAQQAKMLAEFKTLQKEHEQVKLEMNRLMQSLPQNQLDDFFAEIVRKMDKRIGDAEAMIKGINRINEEISQQRGQLLHPTIRLDPTQLAQMKKADRLYSGDYNMLAVKHGEYLSSMRIEVDGLTIALEEVRSHLKSISDGVSKQLQMQLPEDLADDLLEMNLAVGRYEGQLARFQERWDRYRAKLKELLAAPAESDFDAVQTLLSQLRQDLAQRTSRLADHLEGLYRQLRQGSRSSGKLSSLTARNVACSAISRDIEQTLESWRKMAFHLNRLFPDGNVNLLTLGRSCRMLQMRLGYRQRQLEQMLEQKQTVTQKRQSQIRLAELQKEFAQTSRLLLESYRQCSEDQRQLADFSRNWPKLQRAQDALRKLEDRMSGMEKELNAETVGDSGPEKLEVEPVIVHACNSLGFKTQWENVIEILLGVAGVLAMLIVKTPSHSLRPWFAWVRTSIG